MVGRGLPSHVRMADTPQAWQIGEPYERCMQKHVKVVYMGLTRISGDDLREQLGRFFKRGSPKIPNACLCCRVPDVVMLGPDEVSTLCLKSAGRFL